MSWKRILNNLQMNSVFLDRGSLYLYSPSFAKIVSLIQSRLDCCLLNLFSIVLVFEFHDSEARLLFFVFFQKMRGDLNVKKSLLGTLEAELQRALQVHSQSCQAYNIYDLDLGKYSDRVGQLMDRWQRVEKQIDDRYVYVF